MVLADELQKSACKNHLVFKRSSYISIMLRKIQEQIFVQENTMKIGLCNIKEYNMKCVGKNPLLKNLHENKMLKQDAIYLN